MKRRNKSDKEWFGKLIKDIEGRLRIRNYGKYGDDMLGRIVEGEFLGTVTVRVCNDGEVPIPDIPKGANAYAVSNYNARVVGQGWDSFMGESKTYYDGTADIAFYHIWKF